MAEQFRITIDQLDKAGNAWRTFYLHPRNEGDVQARIARIERAYLMTATRVTIERPGQPAEVVGPYPTPAPSPDAAEQTPIITPELRRAVVAAAHAESVSREAHERVAELRAAADLDDMADPHTYAPDTRYAAAHDAQSAAAPAVDPVAAIVDLIEQYGAARASAAVAGRFSYEGSVSYRENAADLLERIRRTLADALGSRRDRERYAVLMSVGGRPVVCPHQYGVFDSCPICDGTDDPESAEEEAVTAMLATDRPAAWRAPLGPQVVAALIRISNAGGQVFAVTLPNDIVRMLLAVRWVEHEDAYRLRLTDAGKEAVEHARQSS